MQKQIDELKKLRDESIFLTQKINTQKREIKQYFSSDEEYDKNLAEIHHLSQLRFMKPQQSSDDFLNSSEILKQLEYGKGEDFLAKIKLMLSEESFFSSELHNRIQALSDSLAPLSTTADQIQQTAITNLLSHCGNDIGVYALVYQQLEQKAN